MYSLTQRRSCATQNLSQWSTSDEIDHTRLLEGYDTAITSDKKFKERQWILLHSKPIEKCYLSSASSSIKNTENQATMAQSVEHPTTAWKVSGSIPGQHHLFDPNSETCERIGLKTLYIQAFDITLASAVIIIGDKNNTKGKQPKENIHNFMKKVRYVTSIVEKKASQLTSRGTRHWKFESELHEEHQKKTLLRRTFWWMTEETLPIFQAQLRRLRSQNWKGSNPAAQQPMAPRLDAAIPSISDQSTLNEQEKHLQFFKHKLRAVSIKSEPHQWATR